MKIIGVIPARYNSSRLPGKPLADICGKPMIWWVYNQVKKVKGLNEVYVATDDQRIVQKCIELDINYLITSNNHPNHIYRVQEVSEILHADYYVCINGDEPIIEPEVIDKMVCLVNQKSKNKDKQVFGLMRYLKNPAETVDFSNIKVVTSSNGDALYMSRSPIPYPKGTLSFRYKKYIGVEGFNKEALDFYVSTPSCELETIEDIDHLRFLENDIKIKYSLVESNSLSVDTKKDLEEVRLIISKRARGNLYE